VNQSIPNIAKIKIIPVLFWVGNVNIDIENRCSIYENASLIVGALKNIQPKQTRVKVISIEGRFFSEGTYLFSSILSKYFLFWLKTNSGIKAKACIKPQITKVQLAPCQKPLTMKMINVFLIALVFPPLLHPKGI
jgi:hypothetical protein